MERLCLPISSHCLGDLEFIKRGGEEALELKSRMSEQELLETRAYEGWSGKFKVKSHRNTGTCHLLDSLVLVLALLPLHGFSPLWMQRIEDSGLWG